MSEIPSRGHAFSPQFEDALELAARAHSPQKRRGSDTPYIVHPVHVSVILLRYGFPEEIAVAGLLHDVVEDQGVPLERIEAQFGTRVADVVAAVTEQKEDDEGNLRPWEERKREALDHLREADRETVAVKAADVIHNTCTLAGQVRRQGPAIWKFYRRGAHESLWYYRRVADLVRDRLGTHPLVDELDRSVEGLEAAVAGSEKETRNG